MKFVVLGHLDPNDEAFWSGIPMQLVAAMRRGGHDVATIGPLDPGVTLWGRIKGRFYRHAFRQNYLINRDPAIFRARAKQANELLRDHEDADAIIVPYVADAAYLRCSNPLILVHDATWAGLIDFYPGYERSNLAPETVSGGFELDRRALENCDCAVYASHWAAESAVREYGVNGSKLRVVPLGAGVTDAPSDATIAQAIQNRRVGPVRLLFVGIDWYRKGGDIAIEIARQLHEGGLAVELTIVGCHPPEPLPPFVRALGFLSKKDPASAAIIDGLFQGSTLLLMPSRAECYGLVFCEAAAYGLPVVSTNVGGIPEILQDQTWGRTLARGTTADQFARTILEILADRTAYDRMVWAARRDFSSRLNWDTFCRELVAIVRTLEFVERKTEPGPRAAKVRPG